MTWPEAFVTVCCGVPVGLTLLTVVVLAGVNQALKKDEEAKRAAKEK